MFRLNIFKMEVIMKRCEVNKELTWDLTHIYENDEKFQDALSELSNKCDEIYNKFSGKLKSANSINECLDLVKEANILADLTGSYAYLHYETDLGNSENLERLVKYENVAVPALSKLSFVDTEILENSKEVIEEAMENCENKRALSILLEKKDHTLSKDVETVISELSPILSACYRTYNQSKIQDLSFDEFNTGGKKYSMSYNEFESSFESDADTEVRRNAFKEFYKNLQKYENTFASTYFTNVQHDKIVSKLRNYDNVFEYLLSEQEVSMDLYNRQCDVIMEKLAPHIRRYAKLLKRVNNLDKMTFMDMKMPLDSEFSKEFSIEECKNMVIDGLSVLGEDYSKILKDAFDNRYIDYVDNEGKSSGAFCATPYRVHPYILLTWKGNMSDILTVAHELGHGGHFTLAGENQNPLNVNCSTYFVEAPSTTNELIMAHYLLNNAKSDREKRWIISQIISGTYYHNFVTHFIEAYYQREVYRIIEKGGAIDATTLNRIFRETMEKFYGEDIEIPEGMERTWMRQPHYYMGLYSYTYSAGLTIGTQMCLNILKDKEKAKDWIEVLKAGGSKKPIELAKMAGVDITTDEPLLNTIEYIGKLIEEMEKLTDKIDGK